MKLALQLVKNEIPCRTLGDTLAKSLISTVQNRKARNIDDLLLKLATYEEQCLRSGSAMAKQATADRFDCIRHILKSCNSIDEFEPLVQSLLRPQKGIRHITLCTIHKAKGLEADVIGILNPPVPSERAQSETGIKQEVNIDFVAHTRTKRDLYYIYND
jgi:superfamily I DNA/RNA helicase